MEVLGVCGAAANSTWNLESQGGSVGSGGWSDRQGADHAGPLTFILHVMGSC